MTYRKQLHTPVGIRFLERIRGYATPFPEVEEAIDKFGHTSFRVRDKPFVILGEGDEGPSLSFKADRHHQDFLVKRGPYHKARYIGHHGWTSVLDDEIQDWDEVEELIRQAYVIVAPAKLAKEVDTDE